MTVTLTPDAEALVKKKVETGSYSSADDVIHEALRLLDERDAARIRLRAAIAVGDEDLERGNLVDWTPDFFERLKQEADEEDRLGTPIRLDVQP
jgi:antitoxin ParD1/3/4